MKERSGYKTSWLLRKYADERAFHEGRPFEEKRIEGNCLLNEGINLMLNLLSGGPGTAFTNATAHIGVGDGEDEEDQAQTSLLGPNKTYAPMENGFPYVAGGEIFFRSVFGPDQANYNWREFTVANSNSDAGVNLNRKVKVEGTKAQGQVWTLDLSVKILNAPEEEA